jgi:hypothetical protein
MEIIMRKLEHREFEISMECGINIVICTVPMCSQCKECVNDPQWSTITDKYPFVNIYTYDISTDVDKCEKYKLYYTPSILIFKGGKLSKNFVYSNVADVLKKLDIQKIDLLENPCY